ncbi:MAG: hypothetical protein IPK80_21330 [Nannocystis sp.]|nr:hypothetical protein [Nannocystis sp.]
MTTTGAESILERTVLGSVSEVGGALRFGRMIFCVGEVEYCAKVYARVYKWAMPETATWRARFWSAIPMQHARVWPARGRRASC